MANTTNLALPLVAGNQAQKHVTVNEALVLLDGLSHLTLQSAEVATPPAGADDGQVWAVPTGASSVWSGHEGTLAVRSNGGWVHVTPQIGWNAFVADIAARAVFDGVDWIPGAGAVTANGAGMVHRSIEVDVTMSAGGNVSVLGMIPAHTVVYGLTGRVLSDVGGVATFRLGVPSSDDRYGSGIGTGAGSWMRGLTGTPLAYYADTDMRITAEGGAFDGTGSIRLAVHLAEFTLPRA